MSSFGVWANSHYPSSDWTCRRKWDSRGSVVSSHPPNFDWNCDQKSSFEVHRETSPHSNSGWTLLQISGSQGPPVTSHAPGRGKNHVQMSSFVAHQATSHHPIFGWICPPESIFEDQWAISPDPMVGQNVFQTSIPEACQASSPHPNFCRKTHSESSSATQVANANAAIPRWTPPHNLKVWRPLGRATFSHFSLLGWCEQLWTQLPNLDKFCNFSRYIGVAVQSTGLSRLCLQLIGGTHESCCFNMIFNSTLVL